MKLKNLYKYAIYMLLVFSFLIFFLGCIHTRSTVQDKVDVSKIKLVQLASESGDLHILSSYYNLKKDIEVSYDGGNTWNNNFTYPYNNLADKDIIEVKLRKKEVLTDSKAYLTSPSLTIQYTPLTLNKEIPHVFDEIILAKQGYRISRVAQDLEINTKFLLIVEYDYGIEIKIKRKIERSYFEYVNSSFEYALLDNKEKESISNEAHINWQTTPYFSAYDYDLNTKYHLFYRIKESSIHTSSSYEQFIINPDIFLDE